MPPSIRAMIPPDAIELLAHPGQLLNGYLRCAVEAGGRYTGLKQVGSGRVQAAAGVADQLLHALACTLSKGAGRGRHRHGARRLPGR